MPGSNEDLNRDGMPDGWFDLPLDCYWFSAHPEWGPFDPTIDDNPFFFQD